MQDEEEEGARIHTQTNEESRAHTHKNTRPRGKGGMGYGQRKRGGGGRELFLSFSENWKGEGSTGEGLHPLHLVEYLDDLRIWNEHSRSSLTDIIAPELSYSPA